jgi:beta-lactamase class D
VLANAREVLARLERYELEVFAEEDQIAAQAAVRTAEARAAVQGAGADHSDQSIQSDKLSDKLQFVEPPSGSTALEVAARRAGRRRAAAQSSLFDLANQKVVDEIRDTDPETLSPEDAKELLRRLRQQMM